MLKIFTCLVFLVSFYAANSTAQPVHPDSAGLALKQLTGIKQQLLKTLAAPATNKVPTIQRMLELGMWKEAAREIERNKVTSKNYKLLSAEYLVLNNQFKQAEKLVNSVLESDPRNEKAVLIKASLEIHAWRLDQAVTICEQSLKRGRSEKLQLMLGRARLLQKDYTAALAIAKKVLQQNPESAGAFLLEADVYFWNQQPELAEAPLKRSLEIDPYNADARFSYGYAIWRRVDATQLNAMASQWELALAINPLHFQTHWHWGNGHTNLTYADYSEKDDDLVRKALEKADDLVRKNQVQAAIDFSRSVEKQYSGSVLPAMHRASIYYTAFDMDRALRLDSAENIFRKILSKKSHYGPAHNGLAAVVKSKRIPYLARYDSISNSLRETRITDMDNFQKVFPDVSYFPGETAKAMVWNQLYAAVVYFPFLSKQDNAFRIPPLHNDLAITMNSPAFRYMTTFDNRQWMDIRGVGSGAAAIEYVERGAFMERNVILHEYAHLFHGSVLTDAENRKIRALYYQAMKEKRTLDYYSQNNESEYFAQTYPAYFEPLKLHPLDFKSMNTTSDLIARDPEMYRFLDELVKKERAYLAGDKKAMASNWSQVYVNLSNESKQKKPQLAAAYLDTALVFDQKYLPAFLSHSQLNIEKQDFKKAAEWLKKAEEIDPLYAPIYSAYAGLSAARLAADEIDQKTSVKEQATYLERSFQLETDFQERASINRMLREMYKSNGMLAEAIETATAYTKGGSTVSTYLRDRRDDAAAFAALLRSSLGYTDEVSILKKLVDQKPQNFEYRNMYADALSENKQYYDAIRTLQEAQRILAASGNARSDYTLRLAELYTMLGEKDSSARYINLLTKARVKNQDKLRYVRLLSTTGSPEQAFLLLKSLPVKGEPFYLADYFYTNGRLLQADGKRKESIAEFEKALTANPYLLSAVKELIKIYKAEGQEVKANEVQRSLLALPIQLGPGYQSSIGYNE